MKSLTTLLVITLLTTLLTLSAFAQQPKPKAVTPIQHGITLSWMESTAGTSFNIYKGVGPGGEVAVPYASVGVGVLTYKDTTGAAGTQYCYVVTAVLATIESSPSNEACGIWPNVPPAPTSLTVSAF